MTKIWLTAKKVVMRRQILEMSDPDFIYITLSSGIRFTLYERNGVLDISTDDVMYIHPRASNRVHLFGDKI